MGNWFGSSTQGDYGDIMKIKTSGASDETSAQDNLDYSGIDASHDMAEADLKRMKKYKDKIFNVAAEHKVDPALIAGIISRESRAGNALDKNGRGDYGKAFGLMQIDTVPVRNGGGGHTPRGAWDSQQHLSHATGILVDFIKKIQRKFPNWSREEQLKGGIAAYNQGDGAVESKDVDKNTTGGDYANDVVARAQWYRREGGFK